MFGEEAAIKLSNEYHFESILDIGGGQGNHRKFWPDARYRNIDLLNGEDFMDSVPQVHDAVWCCHVLEHQINVNKFLERIHLFLTLGGVLAVTVPPLKHQIVGGHVSLWNAGLLIYNLVLAGFNCKGASIKQYGYNISVIVRRIPFILPDLKRDSGDIDRLSKYLPDGWREGFNGNIRQHNW